MSLPNPLGPYHVSFADFELRRSEENKGSRSGRAAEPEQQQIKRNGVHPNAANADSKAAAVAAPPMRIFYPTETKTRWSPWDVKERCWIPHYNYMWGYVARAFAPSSVFSRLGISVIASIFYSVTWFRLPIQASVKKPLLTPKGEEGRKKQRLPVVIFSHGIWACHTTYSATCVDLASHGYIVVAVEHLDGSSSMAHYHDHEGKCKWVHHAFGDKPVGDTPMAERAKQLRQRVGEIQKVIDVLESLDQGSLMQNFNSVTGRASLDTKFFQQRLDLNHIAMHGHSFGGATAIATSGVDKRIKCCLAEDVWWEPLEEVDYSRLAGKVPVLLLNTESFNWAALRNGRKKFMKGRAHAHNEASPLITALMTIKGTTHMDQCDFPLLFPNIAKIAGMTGALQATHSKDINSRACLDFLYKNLLPPETGAPYLVDSVKEDGEHLLIGEVTD
ncbi:unnamed protein product [Sphagnum troendelagicum]|uniref:1-alkyl-2-acetylglycerophosphocholine esterase n=1 Tax=Sphagnum troendelagicum TaxID=128251 RepID=A0ABP0V589_9BRYO